MIPSFAGNWEDAHEHHIFCGAYHYFLPDKDAKKQAENFISSVTLHQGDLPPVIDIEDTRVQTQTRNSRRGQNDGRTSGDKIRHQAYHLFQY
jgi:GH25 family lysozyme M1 (1,4-beta-N-acetylmuramidase)